MVIVLLEGLRMVSDELSILYFSSKFTGPDLQEFSVFKYHGACELSIKKAPNQAKDLIKIVSVTLEGLWMVSDTIVDSLFFVKFHRSGPPIIFNFWTITEHVSYSSKKLLIKQWFIAKKFVKMVIVTLEAIWMVSDRIVDFRFFVKFNWSRPALIFSSWTIMEKSHIILATSTHSTPPLHFYNMHAYQCRWYYSVPLHLHTLSHSHMHTHSHTCTHTHSMHTHTDTHTSW